MMQPQALLFDKRGFNQQKAKTWAATHGFKTGKVEASRGFLRLYCAKVDAFEPGSFRTTALAPGVKVVTGELAEARGNPHRAAPGGRWSERNPPPVRRNSAKVFVFPHVPHKYAGERDLAVVDAYDCVSEQNRRYPRDPTLAHLERFAANKGHRLIYPVSERHLLPNRAQVTVQTIGLPTVTVATYRVAKDSPGHDDRKAVNVRLDGEKTFADIHGPERRNPTQAPLLPVPALVRRAGRKNPEPSRSELAHARYEAERQSPAFQLAALKQLAKDWRSFENKTWLVQVQQQAEAPDSATDSYSNAIYGIRWSVNTGRVSAETSIAIREASKGALVGLIQGAKGLATTAEFPAYVEAWGRKHGKERANPLQSQAGQSPMLAFRRNGAPGVTIKGGYKGEEKATALKVPAGVDPKKVRHLADHYQKWHWSSPATKVFVVSDSLVPDLVGCGELISITLKSGRTIKFQKGAWLGYDPAHPHQRLHVLQAPAQREAGRKKMKTAKTEPLQAIAKRAGGTQVAYPLPNIQAADLGPVASFVYETHKAGDGAPGEHSFYEHEMGQEHSKGVVPHLARDVSGRLWFAGGCATSPWAGVTG